MCFHVAASLDLQTGFITIFSRSCSIILKLIFSDIEVLVLFKLRLARTTKGLFVSIILVIERNKNKILKTWHP